MSKKDRETNRTARAAAIQKEQADKERNRKLAIVAVILIVLGGLVAAGFVLTGGSSSTPAAGATPKAVASGQGLVVGDDPNASVKVVVYEDFLCPYCRELEASTRSFLRKGAAQGKVLVEYRPFRLLQDPYSEQALTAWGHVLQDGTPEQALALHDLLYENQPYEAATDKPGLDKLKEWAEEAGVKDSTVLSALGKADPTFVEAANAAATAADVQGTPTVVVNGKTLEGTSISQLADQLEQLVEQG